MKILFNLNVFGSSVWGTPFEALPMLDFEDLPGAFFSEPSQIAVADGARLQQFGVFF